LFQSHNGAIAALLRHWHDRVFLQFQSHNGAIAALSLESDTIVATAFQSHNGAIAACAVSCSSGSVAIVSIPQWCDCCPWRIYIGDANLVSFNPTMVRLLHCCDRDSDCCLHKFQSHNGAIAASQVGCRCFQDRVSIPQWCDCCSKRLI